MNDLLLTLFSKYSTLLKHRFSEDFLEIVHTDDYMPMPINSSEEYDKVVSVSWYNPPASNEPLTFPCVLPFSQMYPLCCIDIRNFLNQIYLFSDDYFQKSSIIDETLRTSLDELLCEKVCGSLIEKLASQYPGQIVQILTNLLPQFQPNEVHQAFRSKHDSMIKSKLELPPISTHISNSIDLMLHRWTSLASPRCNSHRNRGRPKRKLYACTRQENRKECRH